MSNILLAVLLALVTFVGFRTTAQIVKLRKLKLWYQMFVKFYDLPEEFKLEDVANLTAESLLFGREPQLTHTAWFEYGTHKEWITPSCITHIGLPITPYEYAQLQGTSGQWLCDIVEKFANVEHDSAEDHTPHIFIARLNGPEGSWLSTGLEDLDDQKLMDQLREQMGDE